MRGHGHPWPNCSNASDLQLNGILANKISSHCQGFMQDYILEGGGGFAHKCMKILTLDILIIYLC